jgi:hypothetical protein
MTAIASGSTLTSSLKIVIYGSSESFLVMYSAKRVQSTARAEPAGTVVASAASMIRDPAMESSFFRSPGALWGSLDLRELEQTSSPRLDEVCASVIFSGRIS